MKSRRSSLWVMIDLLAGSQGNMSRSLYQGEHEFGMRAVILECLGSWAAAC
jgi:hypothetical protein